MGKRRWRLATALLGLALLAGSVWAKPAGGVVVLRPAVVGEQGSLPRLLVQTVPDASVTATVLAIRYRRPGEMDASVPGVAHLLEHLLFRTRAGQPAGALLVRAEGLGGQNVAYSGSGVMVLGEVVPSEMGLESLALQLERLRTTPSDTSDLSLEKTAIASEIATVGTAEELARRRLLAGLGVDAAVEGQTEALAALAGADLEKLLAGLDIGSDVVIAVVGPHTDAEVRESLNGLLKPLKPARKEARARVEHSAGKPGRTAVPSNYDQESFFLQLPGLSTAELLMARDLLSEAAGTGTRVELVKEDLGLYRLDVSPAAKGGAPEIGRLLGTLAPDDAALGARLRREWLDRFEAPLPRAEMMALEALDLGTVASAPEASQVPAMRERLLPLLKGALEQAPSLLLRPSGRAVEGLYPFRQTANATGALQRQTLTNGLSVVWQELKSWPVVAISGFFRLRRPLTPDECEALENKLEARSFSGLDYEVKPDGLFFHTWCPSSELKATLESSAAEIRALSESSEVLVEGAFPSPTVLSEFFLGKPGQELTAPISGRTLAYPEGGELVLVGDIDPQALDRGLRPAWNGWFADKPLRSLALATPAPPAEFSRVIAVPAGQSPLMLMGVWGPSRSAPDFLPFNLAMQTLAGRPTTGLLARKLRDSDGLVQTVTVTPLTGSDHGDGRQLWMLALRPGHAGADPVALAARVQSMVSALGKEALAKSELARTRNFLKAALKISTSTPRGRARVLANSEFYRLSDSYSTDYAGLYDRIDPNLVLAVCGKHLAEQNCRWLFFQPAAVGGRSEG